MSYNFAILGSRGYPSTYGGFETLVRRLAPYLRLHGDDVTVYCRGRRKGMRVIDGVRCVTTRGLDTSALSTLSFGMTGSLHARGEPYDAALVLNVANGFFIHGLQAKGIPCAVNVDGIEWERQKWNALGRLAFRAGARLTARSASRLVFDSEAIGRIWGQQFHREGWFIPYGAEVGKARSTERIVAMGLPPGGYALVVARLVPENNVALFVEALEMLDPRVPAVIVGTGKESAQSRELVDRGRALGIRWAGHVDDQELLADLWSHCGVYFHGHSVGGTNPGLLQALGYGAPTLALDTPFNREVLAAPEQLVSKDPSELARRVAGVLGARAVREAFAQRGREVVAQRYSWETVLHTYRALLIELAEKGSGRSLPEARPSRRRRRER